jgi:hypothetical protein
MKDIATSANNAVPGSGTPVPDNSEPAPLALPKFDLHNVYRAACVAAPPSFGSDPLAAFLRQVT